MAEGEEARSAVLGAQNKQSQVDTVRRAFGSDSEGAEKPVEDSEPNSGMMGLVL